MLCCCLLIAALSLLALHALGRSSPSALSSAANGTEQAQGLNPNMLEDPATYNARPCLANPSDATCSGIYPVTPQHVSAQLGVPNGAGACIDKHSKIAENQVITNTSGKNVGNLRIFWLPTCQAYFGTVSFSFPLSQVTQASIWVQTESNSNFVQWFEQASGLAPAVHHFQQTGPVTGADLTQQELYSPLIWAQGDPTSVYIDIQLADGEEYGNFTASYSAGVEAYNGVP
jgi:hypothetical protein